MKLTGRIYQAKDGDSLSIVLTECAAAGDGEYSPARGAEFEIPSTSMTRRAFRIGRRVTVDIKVNGVG